MPKLHELLAVEPDLKSRAQTEINRIKAMFAKGAERLVGQVRTYHALEEGGVVFDDEIVNVASTVPNELGSLRVAFGDWIDVAVGKEIANKSTSADVQIGEQTILAGLPAPALLNIESKLAELRKVYEAIPTNDPAVQWEHSGDLDIYVSPARHQHRTEKRQQALVLYPATPEHQAQTQLITKDVIVGTVSTVVHSGMVSVTKKRLLLNRLDMLARAVKQARQRGNDVKVVQSDVSDAIFNFIHGE